MGWPVPVQADRIGVRAHRLYALLGDWQETPVVHRSIADSVTALYNELSMTRGPSPRTASTGLRHGWPAPLDLDDNELDW